MSDDLRERLAADARRDERAATWLPVPLVPESLLLWRSGMGWTQAQAAAALGIKVPAYIARERGVTQLRREHILACWCIVKLYGGAI